MPPPCKWPLKQALCHPWINAFSILGSGHTAAQCKLCLLHGQTLWAARKTRNGTGSTQHGYSGPLLGFSYFIKKASQASASASTLLFSHRDILMRFWASGYLCMCAVSPSLNCSSLCFPACKTPPCSSTPRSVVICAVLSLHSAWVNSTLLGSWGLFLFLFPHCLPLSAFPTGVGPQG